MSPQNRDTRRAHYRVIYPIEERPRFIIGDAWYSVVDCSELGMCYRTKEGHEPEVGSDLEGTLSFRRGVDIQVAGQVVRVQENTVALCFVHEGIPFVEIMAEQRYLRTKNYAQTD